MYKENFPKRAKYIRSLLGYTQQQVSDQTGISRANISKYENGTIEPSLEHLGILAQFYNVQINWLLGVSVSPEIKIPVERKSHLEEDDV